MAKTAGAGTIRARPTLYRGIRMRSRLEADYAAHLDANGEKWTYEPECFASAEGQWLPDFETDGKFNVLTEVKPANALPDDNDLESYVDAHLAKLTIAWASRPLACLQLVYWNYGGPMELCVFSGCKGEPWWAQDRGGTRMLLWPGMRQFERLYIGHGG